MGRREGSPMHGAMNVISTLLLCLTLGRLLFVLHSSQENREQRQQRVPEWMPAPKQVEPRRTAPYRHETTSHFEDHHTEVVLVDSQQPNLRGMNLESRDGGGNLHMWEGGFGEHSLGDQWGTGMRVLIFTMDSLQDRVAFAAKGGPAGEIKIRESLTRSLEEAGVEVEIAVSDRDFERRAGAMDMYNAYVLDPWTWAGKGWRLKAQLKGRQHKIFILDFFGSDKPHANLGVPTIQHLTAFPVPLSQERTFLGYRIDLSELPSGNVVKRRQGVLWGKTVASFEGQFAQNLIARLADFVELHSTIDPKDATIRHSNIVYHGILSKEEWQRLLQESKFMIGLGDPLSGPSAVDAVLAGCAYLNPVYSAPVKKVYNSQHPYLAQSVGEPYVCSFEQKDAYAAVECARKALDQDLEPLLPWELRKEEHAQRVRDIFQPMAKAEG